jgi:glycosyltransferase involved in cell wall biosynthesis
VIAGDGEERAELDRLIDSLALRGRAVLTGPLGDEAVLDHFARCRAVCFAPLLEDYGFVTVEAFSSGKAVVTCRDSGGPAELVTDGVNGLVCDPTPESLARALRRLADDPALAERLGAEARSTAQRMTWPDAVRQLTAL